MLENVRKRTRFFGEFFALFIGGAIASRIFAPYEGAFWGYVSLIIFFAYLFGVKDVNRYIFWKAYIFAFTFFMVGFAWICKALLLGGDNFIVYVPLVLVAMGAFFGLFIAIPVYMMKWGNNLYSRALILCVGIVFFEWVRSWIFTGFPWNLFGSALGFDIKLIKGGSVVGVYGLSFMLLLWVSGLGLLLNGLTVKRFDKNALWFLLVSGVFFVFFGVQNKTFEDGNIKVRLVQTDIKQVFKWNEKLLYENFRKYIDLSKSKTLEGVSLVVWGETATPYMLDRDEKHLNEIREAIGKGGFLVTGLIRAGFEYGEYVPYNSLFVIDDKGRIRDYYDKVHLVPFGEYLPFREYLPDFMKPVANVVGNLGEGEKYKNIMVDGLPLMGGAICYESIFPKSLINPKEKPDILLVLANDGWYGISGGPYQHLVASQLRAVEEGITVIRSANTGISAVIKPNGEVVGSIDLGKSGISDVVLPKILSVKTIYGKVGNWIVFGILAIAVMIVFLLNKKIVEK